MRVYLRIQFAEGIKLPFVEFCQLYNTHYIFEQFPIKERERHLKEAYKIATAGNIIEDGELSTIPTKSEKTNKK